MGFTVVVARDGKSLLLAPVCGRDVDLTLKGWGGRSTGSQRGFPDPPTGVFAILSRDLWLRAECLSASFGVSCL